MHIRHHSHLSYDRQHYSYLWACQYLLPCPFFFLLAVVFSAMPISVSFKPSLFQMFPSHFCTFFCFLSLSYFLCLFAFSCSFSRRFFGYRPFFVHRSFLVCWLMTLMLRKLGAYWCNRLLPFCHPLLIWSKYLTQGIICFIFRTALAWLFLGIIRTGLRLVEGVRSLPQSHT